MREQMRQEVKRMYDMYIQGGIRFVKITAMKRMGHGCPHFILRPSGAITLRA